MIVGAGIAGTALGVALAQAELPCRIVDGRAEAELDEGAFLALANVGVPELLARADFGLYEAKAEGRDQVRFLTRSDPRARHMKLAG